MKPKSIPVISIAFASVLVAAGSAQAAIVFATENSRQSAITTDELTYAGDVSATDLLTGIAGTGGIWNVGGGSSPSGLNDGNAGGDYDLNGISALQGAAWAADGTASTRTFVLGLGPNGLGFTINSIQSIAAWQGAGFANQKYDVFVRTIGEDFTFLTSVDYQPFTDGLTDGGSSKVNVTEDVSNILASGIDAIRFDFLDTISNDGGGVVMREIDVFGAATTVPEPSTLAIAALGGLALLRRRR